MKGARRMDLTERKKQILKRVILYKLRCITWYKPLSVGWHPS